MAAFATIKGEAVHIEAAFKYKDCLKAAGAKWNPVLRVWVMPLTEKTVGELRDMPGIQLAPELMAMAPAAEDQHTATMEAETPVSPMPIKVKPYAHQIAAYNRALRGPAFAALMEQGCGKSLVAVAVAGRRFLDGQVSRLLVVAPLAVLPVWEREFAEYSSAPHRVTVLQGTAEKREAALRAIKGSSGRLEVAVVNYDAILRLQSALQAWAPDMIICDESQRIKNPQAKQSKAMHELGQRAKYRMILTGTPVSNTPLDFWSQYRFLKPDLFDRSFYAFRNRYAVMGGYGGHEIVKYKNLAELTEKAHSVAFRVTKEQALDLPERIDQTLYCELEPAAAKIYRQMLRDKVAELSAMESVSAPLIVTQMLRLSQIAGGYLSPDDGGPLRQVSKAKMSLLKETLQDLLEQGEKVVIFCRFRAEIDEATRIAEELVGAAGVRGIWGDIPGDKRGEAVAAFQGQPEVRIFIAQIQCAGAGITLHAARTAIFYSLDYSYNNYDQAKARIHRIGQHRPCNYIHLVARGTVDEAVMQALADKRSIAQDIVDNWRTVFAPEHKRRNTHD